MAERIDEGASRQSVDELSRQIAQLREDLSQLGATLAQVAQDQVEEFRDSAADRVADVRKTGERYARDAARRAEESGEALERFIAERPLTAVLVSAGLGYRVGILTRK